MKKLLGAKHNPCIEIVIENIGDIALEAIKNYGDEQPVTPTGVVEELVKALDELHPLVWEEVHPKNRSYFNDVVDKVYAALTKYKSQSCMDSWAKHILNNKFKQNGNVNSVRAKRN